MDIEDRIEKALDNYCKNRDSMHVPPKDTDVDIVLTDCRSEILYLKNKIKELERSGD